jgi:hypothetical protein
METKKEIYRQKAQARFDQMNAQIQELLARFNETKAEAKLKINNQFEDLTNQQETVEQKMEQVKDAGEDAWEDMRSGLDTAMNELETSFNEAAHKLEQITQ